MNRYTLFTLCGALAILIGCGAVLGMTFVGLSFALAPFALPVIAVVLMQPKMGLFLLLFLLALVPPTPQEIGFTEVAYIGVFAATIGGWVLRQGWRTLPPGHTYYPALAVLGLVVFSILLALVNNTPFSLWLRGLIPFGNLLLFFVSASLLRTPKDRRALVGILYGTVFLLALLSFSGAVGTWGLAVSSSNPILLRVSLGRGAFQPLILGTPMFALGYMAGGAKRSSILHPLVLVIGIGCIALTFLRSAFVVIAVAGVLAFWFYVRTHPPGRVIGLIAIISLLLLILMGSGYAISLLRSQEAYGLIAAGWLQRINAVLSENIKEDVRVREATVALSHFVESPLLGKGLGFQYSYVRPTIGSWQGGYTHNIFTYFAMTTGILGLIVLVWFCVGVFHDLAVRFSRRGLLIPEDQAFLAAGILFIVSLFTYAQFQSVFRSVSFFASLSLILGAIANVGSSRRGYAP